MKKLNKLTVIVFTMAILFYLTASPAVAFDAHLSWDAPDGYTNTVLTGYRLYMQDRNRVVIESKDVGPVNAYVWMNVPEDQPYLFSVVAKYETTMPVSGAWYDGSQGTGPGVNGVVIGE